MVRRQQYLPSDIAVFPSPSLPSSVISVTSASVGDVLEQSHLQTTSIYGWATTYVAVKQTDHQAQVSSNHPQQTAISTAEGAIRLGQRISQHLASVKVTLPVLSQQHTSVSPASITRTILVRQYDVLTPHRW